MKQPGSLDRLEAVTVVTAHPDDISTAAGTTRRLLDNGTIVSFVDVSEGESCVPEEDRDQIPPVTEAESRHALDQLGLHSSRWYLNYSELHVLHPLFRGELDSKEVLGRIIAQVRLAISKMCPRLILTGAFEGGNPAHDLVNCIAYHLSKEAGVPFAEYANYSQESDGNLVVGSFASTSGDCSPLSIPEIGLQDGRVLLTPTETAKKKVFIEKHESQLIHLRMYEKLYREDVEMRREHLRLVLSRDHTNRPRFIDRPNTEATPFYETHARNRGHERIITFDDFRKIAEIVQKLIHTA